MPSNSSPPFCSDIPSNSEQMVRYCVIEKAVHVLRSFFLTHKATLCHSCASRNRILSSALLLFLLNRICNLPILRKLNTKDQKGNYTNKRGIERFFIVAQ